MECLLVPLQRFLKQFSVNEEYQEFLHYCAY